MLVQKYIHRECYYALYNIYGNTEEIMDMLAHSTDLWSFCEHTPLLNVIPNVIIDDKFKKLIFEDTRRIVHQGMLDNCKDYFCLQLM